MFSKALGKREISIVRVIATTLLILTCAPTHCPGEDEETIGKKLTMNINSRYRSNSNSNSHLQVDVNVDVDVDLKESTLSLPAPGNNLHYSDNRNPQRSTEEIGNSEADEVLLEIETETGDRNIDRENEKWKFEYSLSKDEMRLYLESRDFDFFNPSMCLRHYPTVHSQVWAYLPHVQKIVDAAVHGSFKGLTYNNLTYFLDTFGPRLSGSSALEDSIDFLKAQLETSHLEKVWTENVVVPQWKRGEERAEIIKPRWKSLALFGLGETVSTPPSGITADVLVLDSYQNLINKSSQLRGKIVVCNYGGPEDEALSTTDNGYAEIADAGALAVLYKSATTFSLYSVHARRANLYYEGANKLIPIAYITVEDSEYLSRIYNRGEDIQIYLKMLDTNGNSTSRNLFGELEGRESPEEIVIVSAHTDSWDAGQGAQDDGIGIYLMLESMELLKSLGLRARRSVRGALWTAEEYGYLGSLEYIRSHEEELDKLRVVLEADYACLAPVGLAFNRDYGTEQKIQSESWRSTSGKSERGERVAAAAIHNLELGCILYYVLQLLGDTISQGALVQTDIFRTDLDHFQDVEIPVVSLLGDDGRYFWFHHTDADTVTALDSQQLDFCLAIWTATTYILADIDKLTPSTHHSSSLTFTPYQAYYFTIPILYLSTYTSSYL